jgi:hypothetical protein
MDHSPKDLDDEDADFGQAGEEVDPDIPHLLRYHQQQQLYSHKLFTVLNQCRVALLHMGSETLLPLGIYASA